MKDVILFFETFIKNYPYVSALLSAAVGYLVMPVVLKIARKYNLLANPNKRTSHNGKIPFVGGLNIFISYFITVLFLTSGFFIHNHFSILGLLIILIVGLVDDLLDVRASHKLVGEMIAGFCLVVLADVRIKSLHGFLGIYELDLLFSYVLSLFVFIAIINAINLVDGIDGLASGLGVVYATFFAVYFQLTEQTLLSVASYTLVGSLSLFFIYNVFAQKRKLFMGDSGSLLLGYMILFFMFRFGEMNAFGKVEPQYYIQNAPSLLFSLLIVPVFDTLRVMITRIKKGISPFKADKNHIHHLLLKLGLKHIQASLILIGSTIAFTLLGILLKEIRIEFVFLIDLIIASSLILYLWSLINKKNTLQK